jgi:hypothetical protein
MLMVAFMFGSPPVALPETGAEDPADEAIDDPGTDDPAALDAADVAGADEPAPAAAELPADEADGLDEAAVVELEPQAASASPPTRVTAAS